MRCKSLSECRNEIARYCHVNGLKLALLDDSDYWFTAIEPMAYDTIQRFTGPTSFVVSSKKGTPYTGKSRLQVVITRFDTGDYEVIVYFA